MSVVHCLTLGSRAIAVTFPDAAMEPLAAYGAQLVEAANAVAYMVNHEHERDNPNPAPISGGLAAVEILTGLASALLQELRNDAGAR